MNTKNIFRMLLVAVALLLGASNAKALSISQSITGKGTVTTNVSEANEGDIVTISAIADTGYELTELVVRDAWSQEVTLTDNTFQMPDKDVTIYATFTAIQYAITINSAEHGTISTSAWSGTGTYSEIITIYTQAEWGYELEEGSITVMDADNNTIPVSSDLKFTMPASDVTISGNFVLIPVEATKYKLTYYTVKDYVSTLYKEYEIEEGAAIPTEPDPDPITGYTFGGWENVPTTMPNYDINVYGTYSAIDYAITITPSEHGSLSAYRETAHYGDEITIHPQADWGYQLEEGSIVVMDADNNTIPVSSDLKFTMPASAVTISGTFVAIAPSEKAQLNMSYSPSSVELTLGEEFTAPTLSIKDAQGNNVTGLTITYSSSNEGLATVADDGTVTLVEGATGSTTITASFAGDETYEAASAQYTITVNKPKRQITLGENEHTIWDGTPEPTHPGEWNLLIDNSSNWVDNTNGTSKIRIYVDNQVENDWKLWMGTYSWGNASWANWSNNGEVKNDTQGTTPYHADGMYFEYEFSEYTKAAIVNGLAISFWGQEIVMVTHITVPEKPALTLTFSATNIDANTRQTEIDEPTLTVTNAAGEEVTGLTFTYISSNTDVAEVDAEGNVTLKGVEGTATITASTEGNDDYSGGSASYTITVTELTYAVSVSGDVEHGTVNISQSAYAEDSDVTFTITPDEGYSLNAESVSITRTDNSESVNFTVEDGTYTFTMPASDVVISATFTINSHDVIYYVDGEEKYRDTYTYGAEISLREKWADTDDTHYSEWTYSGGSIPTTMPDYNVELYSYSTGFAKVEITSSTGYTSFSSVRPLDFSNVEGITAYIVVDADLDGLTAYLQEVTGEVAANTGLILKGSVGEYEIPTATSSGTSYSSNMLVAVSSDTTFGNHPGCFLLVNRNGQPLFAEANTGISKTLPANHAYLYVANASRAQGRYLSFIGDDLTGIGNIEVELTGNEVIYNLNGQRVEKPGKGLYIINGKKKVLK